MRFKILLLIIFSFLLFNQAVFPEISTLQIDSLSTNVDRISNTIEDYNELMEEQERRPDNRKQDKYEFDKNKKRDDLETVTDNAKEDDSEETRMRRIEASLSPVEKMFRYRSTMPKIVQRISTGDNEELIQAETPDEQEKDEIVYQYGYDFFEQNDKGINYFPSTVSAGPDYILGPGDVLSIKLWGKIVREIEVTIDKEGKIVIPDIGKIYLWQMKFSKAQKIIQKELGKKYVNFEANVTLGKMRTIKVFVLGEVKYPGAYRVSPMATSFQALYEAGGPKKSGSMRSIKISRGKGRKKKDIRIDLYKYLIYGDSSQDVNLKDNDIIFVSPIGKVVKITGNVNRSAIYEIKGKTSVNDMIRIAGGLSADSYHKRLQLERIVKNEYRFVTDLKNVTGKDLKKKYLKNGDVIKIYAILPKIGGYIKITGNIKRPGHYELKKNKTLGRLIKSADGFVNDTYQERIEIYRTISKEKKKLFSVNYKTKIGKNFKLKEFDVVKIFSYDDLDDEKYVRVNGAVKKPGRYILYQKMTLNDLVFNAQPHPYVNYENIEIFRNLPGEEVKVIRVNYNEVLKDKSSSQNILLAENDKVFLRYKVGYDNYKKITISGEVRFPGTYMAREGEKLSSIIKRAGGYTEKAFLKGAVFIRKSVQEHEIEGQLKVLERERKRAVYDQRVKSRIDVIAFFNEKIKRNKGRLIINISKNGSFVNSRDDIIIEDGDTLNIPQIPSSIQVIGGVEHPNSIVYSRSRNAYFYINQSGGLTEFAERSNIYILKANGSTSRNLGHIERGDSIYIPETIKESVDWFEIISRTASLVKDLLLIQTTIKALTQ
ncbi:SLBB domain-containing protein [Candidatus Margulisiibacteriota bacterium]